MDIQLTDSFETILKYDKENDKIDLHVTLIITILIMIIKMKY